MEDLLIKYNIQYVCAMERTDIKDMCKSGWGECGALSLGEWFRAMLGQNADFTVWCSHGAAIHMIKMLMGHLPACVSETQNSLLFLSELCVGCLHRNNLLALTQSNIYNKQ